MKIRKWLLEGISLLLIFLVALLVSNHIINKDSDNTTADMGAATFPQVSFSYNGYTLNPLPGYANPMDIPTMRDTITPVTNGQVEVNVADYGQVIEGVDYEVYSLDGLKSLENGHQNSPGESFTIAFTEEAVSEGEHVLMLSLSVQDIGPLYYYTRIVDAGDKNLLICLDYIYDFHEAAIDKNSDSAISSALETSAAGGASDFGHVTINSDYDLVTWGDLHPQVDGSVRWNITEMNSVFTSVRLDYTVDCTGEENENDAYRVQEFFRVRYHAKKGETYLLDYDRRMEQVFDADRTVLGENGLILGVTDGETPYLSNEAGTVVSFVQAGELWCYDRDNDEISQVFSFVSAEGKDPRDTLPMNQIQLLDMDEEGNVTFAVCGYMNRGEHEGEVGVAVYAYDTVSHAVEEKVFIQTDRSYGYAEQELGNFLHYSILTDTLYLFMDGKLYEVDVEKERTRAVAEGLSSGEYVVSDDGRLFAYVQKKNEGETTKILLKNFDTGNDTTLSCEEGERLTPLGFVDHDFVYGTAKKADEGVNVSGETLLPMYKIEILSEEGDVVKTYEENAVYITGATFQDRMVTLSRVTKNGQTYTETAEEYIMSNEEPEEAVLELQTYATDLKATQTRLAFLDEVPDRTPRIQHPQQILDSEPIIVEFQDTREEEQYYVYGLGALQGICDKAGEAIQLADAYDGVVVTGSQAYVWERGNRDLTYSIPEEAEELATIRAELKKGGSPIDILDGLSAQGEVLDLTGCTTEELLYVLNQGAPVIAMTDSDHAILLVGYTDYLVVYEDPETGERTSVSYNTMDEMTQASGHTYVGLLRT